MAQLRNKKRPVAKLPSARNRLHHERIAAHRIKLGAGVAEML
jgi:hypothetical protein